jgi:hypothetical protein
MTENGACYVSSYTSTRSHAAGLGFAICASNPAGLAAVLESGRGSCLPAWRKAPAGGDGLA